MKLNKFKPALGRVYIQPLEESDRTDSGLYLPTKQGQQSATVGRVVATCEPYYSADDDDDSASSGPMYPVGTIVVVGKWSGTELELNRVRCIVINESDVLGTLEEDSEDARSAEAE